MQSFEQVREEYERLMDPDHTWAGGVSGISLDNLSAYLSAKVIAVRTGREEFTLEERRWFSLLGFNLDAMLQNLHFSIDGIDKTVEANLGSAIGVITLTDDQVDNFIMDADALRKHRADYKVVRDMMIEVRHNIHEVAQPSFDEVRDYFDAVLLGLKNAQATTRDRIISIAFTADFDGLHRFVLGCYESLAEDPYSFILPEVLEWLDHFNKHYTSSIQAVFDSIHSSGIRTDEDFAHRNFRVFDKTRSKIKELFTLVYKRS